MNTNAATPNQQHAPVVLPVALLLAWLCPGLGHAYIGEKKRAITLTLTLLTLFTAGLLIGSIDVIDRKNDHLWFVGQIMIGPAAFAVDQVRSNLESSIGQYQQIKPTPDAPFHRSIGRVNEIGTLYTTLAGVLNLLAILDLAGRITHQQDDDEPDPLPIQSTSSTPPTTTPPTTGSIITRENP